MNERMKRRRDRTTGVAVKADDKREFMAIAEGNGLYSYELFGEMIDAWKKLHCPECSCERHVMLCDCQKTISEDSFI